MSTRLRHSTPHARFVLMAILLGALTGCWEEVHYSPPPATSEVARPAPPPAAEPAENFADDVANSLAEEAEPAGETASAVVELETEEPNDYTSTAVTDDRYGSTSPESEPITLPAKEIETVEVPPVTDVVVEPAVPAQPPPDPARSPRRIAWLLGSNLSLAALGNDRALSEERIADWFDKSRRLARLVNVTVADLPPRPTAGEIDPAANRAMEYLFDQGQSVGRHLASQYGDDHAALFELALKSNILLVRYEPNAPVVKALAAAISQAGERAKLTPELYQSLLKLLDENAPAKDVRNAVFDMHAAVDRYLTGVQP